VKFIISLACFTATIIVGVLFQFYLPTRGFIFVNKIEMDLLNYNVCITRAITARAITARAITARAITARARDT
jgi:hypothetical protein